MNRFIIQRNLKMGLFQGSFDNNVGSYFKKILPGSPSFQTLRKKG